MLKTACRLFRAAGQVESKRCRSGKTSNNSWRKWTSLPLGVGFAYVAYQQYGHVIEREEKKLGVVREQKPFGPYQTKIYCSLPLRGVSRCWGWLCDLNIPRFLRRPLIGAYAWVFDCDLKEAIRENYVDYRSLNDFFRRRVKANLRPIADTIMVAPVDGYVHKCGDVVDGRLEQVKGITYTLPAFFGEEFDDDKKLLYADGKLVYCVIYLSPREYHGFHSPVQWDITSRRHVTGYLLSVSHKIVSRMPNLFCLNERIMMKGRWEHGFFSMTAVGATNVGNIRLDYEENLRTNSKANAIGDIEEKVYDVPITKNRGDYVGEFRLGSSIVLVFEVPKNFRFSVKFGDNIRYGEPLGIILDSPTDLLKI